MTIESKISSKIPYLAVAPVAMGGFTIVENPLQISLFLQNKANLPETEMNVNSYKTMNYEQITMNNKPKNKAKQSQFFYPIGGRKEDRKQMSEDGRRMSEYLAPRFIAGLPVGWDIGGGLGG